MKGKLPERTKELRMRKNRRKGGRKAKKEIRFRRTLQIIDKRKMRKLRLKRRVKLRQISRALR